jgi:hypothetical protein
MERGLHEHVEIEKKATRMNVTSHNGACQLELVPEILVRVMLRLVSILLAT